MKALQEAACDVDIVFLDEHTVGGSIVQRIVNDLELIRWQLFLLCRLFSRFKSVDRSVKQQFVADLVDQNLCVAYQIEVDMSKQTS